MLFSLSSTFKPISIPALSIEILDVERNPGGDDFYVYAFEWKVDFSVLASTTTRGGNFGAQSLNSVPKDIKIDILPRVEAPPDLKPRKLDPKAFRRGTKNLVTNVRNVKSSENVIATANTSIAKLIPDSKMQAVNDGSTIYFSQKISIDGSSLPSGILNNSVTLSGKRNTITSQKPQRASRSDVGLTDAQKTVFYSSEKKRVLQKQKAASHISSYKRAALEALRGSYMDPGNPLNSGVNCRPVSAQDSNNHFGPEVFNKRHVQSDHHSRNNPPAPFQGAAGPIKTLTAVQPRAQSNRDSAIAGTPLSSFLNVTDLNAAPLDAFKITTPSRIGRTVIKIPIRELENRNNFQFRLRLRNDLGQLIQEVVEEINHASLLEEFLTPVLPPQLTVGALKPGRQTVGVKQNDRFADSIRVFRRIQDPEGISTTPWQEILESRLDADGTEIRFIDNIATSCPLLYRALPFRQDGMIGRNFASAVVQPKIGLPVDTSIQGLPTLTIAEDGSAKIKIEINSHPSDANGLVVRRYDLTNKSYADFQAGKGPGFAFVGSTQRDQYKNITAPDQAMVFWDESVKMGRRYSYKAFYYLRRGSHKLGPSAEIDYVFTPQAQSVEMTIENPAVSISSQPGEYRARFRLNAQFTDEGLVGIEKALAANGQSEFFEQEIQGDKKKLTSLIAFLVTRENLMTGDVETFGTQDPGVFVDSFNTRTRAGVKPLEPGMSYRYKAVVCLRSAASLFTSSTETQVNTTTLAQSAVQISQFNSPLALQYSSFPSTRRSYDNSVPSSVQSDNELINGMTSVMKTTDIKIPSAPLTITTPMAVEYRNGRLLTWRAAGDLTNIDHFQVIMTTNSTNQLGQPDTLPLLLGTVHPDLSSSKFSFFHEMIPEDFRAVTYKVKTILLNYDAGPSSGAVNMAAFVPELVKSIIPNAKFTMNPSMGYASELIMRRGGGGSSSGGHGPTAVVPPQLDYRRRREIARPGEDTSSDPTGGDENTIPPTPDSGGCTIESI